MNIYVIKLKECLIKIMSKQGIYRYIDYIFAYIKARLEKNIF